MSTKSGQDSQSETESNVPLPGLQLGGSSNLSTRPRDSIFLAPLDLKSGDLSNIKNIVVNNLADIAIEESGQSLSAEGLGVLHSFIENTTRGYVGSLGMVCKGASCPFIGACPLNKINSKLPIGKVCPVESSIVTMWINKHLKALGIENPDDPVHSFDMDMLYELAGQELIRWRCSVHLSDNPKLVSNQQVGATQQGEPLFADVINPVLDVMEKAGKNIAKLREALVATRQAQVKAGQVTTDPTQRAAELREKATKLAKERLKNQEKIKDAEYKVNP
jgi:hypothetical protein